MFVVLLHVVVLTRNNEKRSSGQSPRFCFAVALVKFGEKRKYHVKKGRIKKEVTALLLPVFQKVGINLVLGK